MRKTTGPAKLVVFEIDPDRPGDVYRIVRSGVQEDPVLVNSLRSNFDLQHPPRNVERSSSVIHMGISAYLEADAARGTAKRWPKLGGYLAQIRLTHGHGFNYAHTSPPSTFDDMGRSRQAA